MVIFVTDEGRYWNHKNPVLERYAECVVVVCLNGKPVTDKYRCVVCPSDSISRLGMTDYSVLGGKYKALESVRDELRSTYSYHDNVVFLTDAEPQSLYPYLVLKDEEKYNKMHLWCMSPWKFEPKRRNNEFWELLHDVDKVHSLHYVDSDELLRRLNRRMTLPEANSIYMEWLNSMLPGALFEIETKLQWDRRYYYDINAQRYIETNSSYEEVLNAQPLEKKDVDHFIPMQQFSTLGIAMPQDYPNPGEDVKSVVEQLHPRVDGKKICDRLKRMRQAIADANGIPFKTVDCPSVGPCAGTCQQCDKELMYLQGKLEEIKEEDRVYPQFMIEKNYDPISLRRNERAALPGVPPLPHMDERTALSGVVPPPRMDERTALSGVVPPPRMDEKKVLSGKVVRPPRRDKTSKLKIPAFLRKETDQDE